MKFTLLSSIKKLLFLFLLFTGLFYAKEFLIPLTIGGVMATLFLPFCKWLEAKAIPRFVAVLLCVLILLSGIAAIFALLGWQISELSNDLNLIKEKAIHTLENVQLFIFDKLGVSVIKQSQIIKSEQPSVSHVMQLIGGSVAFVITNFILTLAYVFLFLYYHSHLLEFVVRLSDPLKRDEVKVMLSRVTKVSQQYLLGLSKMIACLWIMYGIGFSVLGVKNALFFAFLCGLLEIVPFIGNITGTLLTLLMAAVQGASTPLLLGIAGTYGVVQFIQGWVLEPLILGPQVKINPLFTILALVLGQLVWGIAGMFLAIPIIAMIKIMCDHIEVLKPFGFLIGELETNKSSNGPT
ncbi:MAG: AI-2E family transporter [Bacteroidia bacterium]|nr:AI-2E family transporter [Bacteroidia bacterium]